MLEIVNSSLSQVDLYVLSRIAEISGLVAGSVHDAHDSRT